MSAPRGWRQAGKSGDGNAATAIRESGSLRQRVVFLERSAQFVHGGIGIAAAVLFNAVGPGLGQRLGSLLPQRDLLGRQLVDLVAGFRLADPVALEDAGRREPVRLCLVGCVIRLL